MSTQSDVRRLAAALPGTVEAKDRFAFSVDNKGKAKGYAWSWNERYDPKKPRRPNPGVLAVRVSGEEEKQFLIEAAPEKFFTEPHYNGYPAVLVRLAAVGAAELKTLLTRAWRIQAPRVLVEEFDTAKKPAQKKPAAKKPAQKKAAAKKQPAKKRATKKSAAGRGSAQRG